ncbi:MAG: hypothetical protein ACXVEE_05355 [Polyangiales bacterium]
MKLRPTIERLGAAIVRLSPLPRDSEGPRSRASVLFAIVVHVVAGGIAIASAREALRPILSEPRPASVRPTGPAPDMRFELDLKTRKEIFAELAAAEVAERKRNIEQNTWQGHLWSREDDRGVQERTLAKSIAARRGISLTQVFLVLDEGIHEQWPGPDGKPLPATAEPLNLRVGW